jgi:hypothetical protein
VLSYRLTHQTGTVEIVLDAGRLVVRTQGTGLADALRTLDVALADLRRFALVPAPRIGPSAGRGAELLLSYAKGGATKKKRVFVASRDPAFVAILQELQGRRPDASLLHLAPRDAYRAVGVFSPRQGVLIVIAIAVALPIVAIVIALVIEGTSR